MCRVQKNSSRRHRNRDEKPFFYPFFSLFPLLALLIGKVGGKENGSRDTQKS